MEVALELRRLALLHLVLVDELHLARLLHLLLGARLLLALAALALALLALDVVPVLGALAVAVPTAAIVLSWKKGAMLKP